MSWDDCDVFYGLWLPVKGAPGYKVSSFGYVEYPTGYITKGRPDEKGYLRVEIKYSKMKTVKVHRLVAEAFCKGPGTEVNHKDSDKSNNHCTNLEWCNRQENMDHYYSSGNVVTLRGENHGSSKLKESDVISIKKMLSDGLRSREISKQFPVSEQMIYRIKYGKAWGHLDG